MKLINKIWNSKKIWFKYCRAVEVVFVLGWLLIIVYAHLVD